MNGVRRECDAQETFQPNRMSGVSHTTTPASSFRITSIRGSKSAIPSVRLNRKASARGGDIAANKDSMRPDIEVGDCGGHCGDPTSVEVFHRVELDYVSCLTFRVPIAHTAAPHL